MNRWISFFNYIFILLAGALKCHQCNSDQDADCDDITEWLPNNATGGTWIIKTDEYLKDCANETYIACVKIKQNCKNFFIMTTLQVNNLKNEGIPRYFQS